MKKALLSIVLTLFLFVSFAQIPLHYYDAAIGLRGDSLKIALHNVIKNHTSVSYPSLWTAYQKTDKKPNGKVWDIYSDNPGGTPPYEFTFITDQCGGYTAEGSCYNREHSFPASWFNDQAPMYSELFHIYPTDGWVNNKRGNLPYGEVTTPPTWTSLNGSKLGSCSVPGYTGTVFEPINEYKGDLARTYFYMMTRYYGEDAGWPGSDMVTGCMPKPWALQMLYQWHLTDTVSQKELNRNDSIFKIQHNRNPYIDNPTWVAKVIGFDPYPVTNVENSELQKEFIIAFPNPASQTLNLYLPPSNTANVEIEMYDLGGKQIEKATYLMNTKIELNVENLPKGMYFIHIQNSQRTLNQNIKFIKTND
jgi:endonuclease I